MSRGAGKGEGEGEGGGDAHGARTLGTGVFLLLAGVSVALLVVSIPVGIAALVVSVVAGVSAARRRTSVEGLPGGPVDAGERLEGFIVDPRHPGDPDAFGLDHAPEHQHWADGIARHEPVPTVRPPNIFEPPQTYQPPRTHEPLRIYEPPTMFEPVEPVEPVVRATAEELLSAAEAELAAELAAELDAVDLADLPPLEDALERDRRIGHLRAAHAEAAEQLNVAVARWHQLAGDEADPYDPEPVIRAHDPQLAFDPRNVEASPTVRTVASYHRSTQARWRVLWASLGADEVPDPADVDEVLASMLADWDRAAAELAQLEAAEARAAARDLLARPIIVVEPSAWISEARLDQVLSSVPDETEVVVVERAG